MKKSHLGLATSAALLSGSVFAEGTLNLNKKSYAIIAPEQQQVASATNGVASLIEARVAKLADIQLKVKSRLEQAGIEVTKQLKNLAAIPLPTCLIHRSSNCVHKGIPLKKWEPSS